MPILGINRDNYAGTPGIVRLTTSDTLSTSLATGYLTAQSLIIAALNNGDFDWILGDMVALAASDGNALCEFDGINFSTLIDITPLGGRVTGILYVTTASTGTFTTPPGTSWISYELIGGGGGGGGVVSTGGSAIAAAGGGGAGSYAKGVMTGGTLLPSYSYTIGAGGIGGVAASNGSVGASSTLGTLTLGGGQGGIFANGIATTAANIANGGIGGVFDTGAASGLITTTGQEGGAGFSILGQIQSGRGGSSPYDAGGLPVNTTQGFANGTNGLKWGSGGSGAGTVSVETLNGGAGAPGALLMIAYGSPAS